MRTTAIVLTEPRAIETRDLGLVTAESDTTVAIEWSAISTGTERLLYDGTMPAFPGMGYPLVPGYEAVGRVMASPAGGLAIGDTVFVPGANCFEGARGLFGASASHLSLPASRLLPIPAALGESATLLALAATARHTFSGATDVVPELIVGHGVLGRLLARIVLAMGGEAPTVWELNPARIGGGDGYHVVHPDDDKRRDYRTIVDVSGDSAILDTLVGRLAPGGEIVLAGFYKDALSLTFPPAFMREARFRVAAQWQRHDLETVGRLASDGHLVLDDLVTHRADIGDAPAAYATAFGDASCLKMVLDWRHS